MRRRTFSLLLVMLTIGIVNPVVNTCFAQDAWRTIYFRCHAEKDSLNPQGATFSIATTKVFDIKLVEPIEMHEVEGELKAQPLESQLGDLTLREQSSSNYVIATSQYPWANGKKTEPELLLKGEILFWTAYPDVIFELALNAVTLLDLDDKVILDQEVILRQRKVGQITAFTKMLLNEVHTVAESQKAPLSEVILEKGARKGQTMYEGMRDANLFEVEAFLGYMAAKPLDFRGMDWRFGKIFAIWMRHGAPMTFESVKEFFNREEDTEMLQNMIASEPMSHWVEVCKVFEEEASTAFKERRFQDAGYTYQALMMMSNYMGDNVRTAGYYFFIGEVLAADDEWGSAEEAFGVAIKLFEDAEFPLGAAFSHNNLGRSFFDREVVGDAKAEFEVAKLRMETALKDSTNDHFRPLYGLIVRNLGEAMVAQGNYKKAVKELQFAEEVLVNEAGITAMKRLAGTYELLSLAHDKLGKTRKAESYMMKARTTSDKAKILELGGKK